MPARGWARTTPSWLSVASALVAVARATPHSRAICRVEGTRSPGASSPSAILLRISAAIRRYGGSISPAIGTPFRLS
nr:hypothetical protein GCM10020093_041180 [Planobispora longispora]